ncbi:type I polyketide synthase [Actinomadura graeca]|uniref:Type I polyketide synthase n=1 Tax=Actinomadura graeca TaxID=2750812 RepID=A0ABX8QYH2_9ACTN|nr:type I polyketide synthase [Actinomadura graeca]QXJ21818.1 type I polyketide synthase [Actinomadura graeca]
MEPIAIIGIGCRFPGADGPGEFWRLLTDRTDAISEVPPDRWNVDDLYDADPAVPGKMSTRWGGFVHDADRFDREFFGISPREAGAIDPQQRLLMEGAWDALQDAGQVRSDLTGSDTGVFVGISTNDYAMLQSSRLSGIGVYSGTGTALSIAANRLSYLFDLRGPSLAVDTACSSSLVAVLLACRSLWDGESRLALAGGVNVILSPMAGINFSKAGVMAADGRCKTFDARADGYVRGEGAGVVVLKPLARALADGDPVRAVIRGGAVMQDGRTNGLMAPNRLSQEALLRAAYRHSGVAPADVDFVEAHGTGTVLGDLMEAQALGSVLGAGRPPGRPCAVGSVKSNIGHLEAAAGVAGLIKTVLALEHRRLPASLHIEEPNPRIDFEALRLRVAAEPARLDGDGPVRAGVSSFGFGGTNAHLVIQEAPGGDRAGVPAGDRGPARAGGTVLIPFSARTPQALLQVAERHLGAFGHDLRNGNGSPNGQGPSDGDDPPDGAGTSNGNGPGAARDLDVAHDLDDIAYTAGARRSHHRHRLALVTGSRERAADQIRAFLKGETQGGTVSGDSGAQRRRKLVFVCSGQGPRWWPLDPALRDEPALLAKLEECDRLIRAEAGWSLLDQLWADEAASRLGESDHCQPALFAVQVALAGLWRSWGVVPDAVVGHSMGEVAAAHLSGALSLEDAVRVVCHRGRLIRTVAGRGRMAVAELTADAAREELRGREDRLAVAAVNAPASTVFTGDPEAVEEVAERLRKRGVFCRVLESVDFASHGPQMEPLTADLAAALRDVRPAAARLPMYSTVTGTTAEEGSLDGAYWARNIREPVLFDTAVAGLLDGGHDVFVELSPHPVLLPAIAQGTQARGKSAALLPSLRRDEPPRQSMLASLGELYVLGFEPAWTGLYPAPRRPVRLPGYPWQRERHWLALPGGQAGPGNGTGHPLLGHHVRLADAAAGHVWENTIAAEAPAFLDDHRVQGATVVPGAAWLEMARAAAAQASGGTPGAAITLTGFELQRMLVLGDDAAALQVRVSGADGTGLAFRAYARPADDTRGRPGWTLHATGRIVPAGPAEDDLRALDLDAARTRCGNEIASADFYEAMRSRGMEYGPAFQAVERLWSGEREALAVLAVPSATVPEVGAYGVHPVLLDAGLQVLGAAVQAGTGADERRPYVPAAVGRVVVAPGTSGAGAPRRLWAHARLRPADGAAPADGAVPAGVVGDVRLADDDGTTVVLFEGVHARRLDGGVRPAAAAELARARYEVRWRPQERTAAGPAKAAGGGWLVLADDGGVGAELAGRLARAGEPVVRVSAGDGYDEADPDHLTARPDRGDDVRRAVAEARRRLGTLRGVVHLWSLDAPAPERTGTAGLRAAQDRGVVSALHLIQALTDDPPPGAAPRLWLLTGGVHAVDDPPPAVSVAQAPLWGLGRVAQLEHPELRPTLVDLEPSPGAPAAEWLAGELHADDPETQVAYRAGRRHVARLVGTGSRRAVPVDVVRGDAAYLVTGGFGALGLLTARWLAGRGARHLVLVGRNAPGAAAEEMLRELRGAGTEVTVARADVGDEEALARVLAEAAASMPPVRGVVHAAGVLEDATLGTLDPARLLSVLEPKVAGAWNLHRLTAGLPLDFFVLFSSIAGTLGSPGQGNYAAGNAFLDALASARASEGRPALSIAWGPWAGTGLSVREGGADRLVALAGIEGIAADTGMEALDRLLGLRTPQIAVAPVDWSRWASASAASGGSPLVSELVAAAGAEAAAAGDTVRRGTLTADGLAAADPGDRRELLEAYLRVEIARALDMPPGRLDVEEPMNSVGLDSLVAVGIKNQIEVDLGISVPMVDVLEGSSVRRLAERMLLPATPEVPRPPAGDDDWEEFDVI